MREIVYPNVLCLVHPDVDEAGYGVCKHVIAGEKVAYTERATPKALGVLMCAHCLKNRPSLISGIFSLCCAHCCRERGWLPDNN